MNKLPANFPKLLREAGLKVVLIPDWENRGRPASTGPFGPVGVLNHHTGAFDRIGDYADDLAYAKWMFLTGRPDLPAPLCQIALSTEGVVYLGAAGRANHAGTAKASGSVASGDGNSLYVGIEWMLSGTQSIPEGMYDAAATLNAVLLRLLGSSVQAVSCHYQTSVTGKWDIGDPNGIPFGDHKVLNVPRFRKAVQKEKDRLAGPPKQKDTAKLTFQHTSMQFSDTDKQMAHDVEKIFSQGKDILTGTEAGGEKSKPLPALMRAAAEKYGYRFHIGRGDWLAVSEKLIKCNWETGYVPVLESHEGAGKHTDRGIPWASFDTEKLGRVTIGCGHYLTKGRKPGDPNYFLNRRYADAIGKWAREKGAGKDIVFYAGDQNIVDRTEDTFFGSPLTSAWDELEKWQNTGHGNIDVIASYDADGRVTAKSIRALDDDKFFLHTDHFAVRAAYEVRLIA